MTGRRSPRKRAEAARGWLKRAHAGGGRRGGDAESVKRRGGGPRGALPPPPYKRDNLWTPFWQKWFGEAGCAHASATSRPRFQRKGRRESQPASQPASGAGVVLQSFRSCGAPLVFSTTATPHIFKSPFFLFLSFFLSFPRSFPAPEANEERESQRAPFFFLPFPPPPGRPPNGQRHLRQDGQRPQPAAAAAAVPAARLLLRRRRRRRRRCRGRLPERPAAAAAAEPAAGQPAEPTLAGRRPSARRSGRTQAASAAASAASARRPAEAAALLVAGADALQAAPQLQRLRLQPPSAAAGGGGAAERARAQPRQAGQPGLRHPPRARPQRRRQQEDEQSGDAPLGRRVHPRPPAAPGRARRRQRRLPGGRPLAHPLAPLPQRHELHGRLAGLLLLLGRRVLRSPQPGRAGAPGLHQLVLRRGGRGRPSRVALLAGGDEAAGLTENWVRLTAAFSFPLWKVKGNEDNEAQKELVFFSPRNLKHSQILPLHSRLFNMTCMSYGV